jgi:hypothetical protein
MSMFGFVHKIAGQVYINDELTVNIKKLSGKQLRRASAVKQAEAVRAARDMGGEMMKAFTDAAADKERERKQLTPEEQREAVYASYDVDTTLELGVTGFSQEKVKLQDGIDAFDIETECKVFRAIIDLAVPPVAQAEAEEGKGSGPSTES